MLPLRRYMQILLFSFCRREGKREKLLLKEKVNVSLSDKEQLLRTIKNNLNTTQLWRTLSCFLLFYTLFIFLSIHIYPLHRGRGLHNSFVEDFRDFHACFCLFLQSLQKTKLCCMQNWQVFLHRKICTEWEHTMCVISSDQIWYDNAKFFLYLFDSSGLGYCRK